MDDNTIPSLLESSLSRIHSKVKAHDVGAITAFRGSTTSAKNKDNNKSLLAYLLKGGYSVTKVKGSYVENKGSSDEKEVGEESFFVADLKDTGRLRDDLIKLGKLYDQDSIFFSAKGEVGYLYGTSARDNAFPGMGKTHKVGTAKFGKAAGEFFSRVGGRQFAFEESVDIDLPDTNNGKFAMSKLAEEVRLSLVSLEKPVSFSEFKAKE